MEKNRGPFYLACLNKLLNNTSIKLDQDVQASDSLIQPLGMELVGLSRNRVQKRKRNIQRRWNKKLTGNYRCHHRFPRDDVRFHDVECNHGTRVAKNEGHVVRDSVNGPASVLPAPRWRLDPEGDGDEPVNWAKAVKWVTHSLPREVWVGIIIYS